MKKSNYHIWVIVALIVVIIAILTLRGEPDGNKLYIDQLEARIEALDHEISILDDKNDILQGTNYVLSDSLNILTNETKELELQKRRAIIYYEKRIKNMLDATVTELDSFFIARYPE